jgi:hypothetical protein
MEAGDPSGMDAGDDKSKPARTRRRTGGKTPTPEVGKRSLNLRIDDDSYQRLSVHALMRKKTVSELVMEFAQGQLREYVVHRRSAGGPDGQG